MLSNLLAIFLKKDCITFVIKKFSWIFMYISFLGLSSLFLNKNNLYQNELFQINAIYFTG